MKKSYLFILLCLLFCGQACVQRSTSDTTNPDPPPLCEETNYDITIQDVYLGVDSTYLQNVIIGQLGSVINGNLPEIFNVAKIKLTHPNVAFERYEFDINEIKQDGSIDPMVILFIDLPSIKIIPIYSSANKLNGFRVEKTSGVPPGPLKLTGITGVATIATLDGFGYSLSISTTGDYIVSENELVCPDLNNTADDSFSKGR